MLQELCFGVCRWFTRLDQIAHQLISKPFKAKDSDLHALILVGLYQLYYLRIPDHAAISETVEASRELNKEWAAKAVNGMLRRAQREKVVLEASTSQSEAVQSAHPKWLVDMLAAAWPNQFADILRCNNIQAPMSLRINAQKTTTEDYLQQLQAHQIKANPCQFSRSGIQLEAPVAVTDLPGFAEGMFFVQDEAAQLAATLVSPQANERILDACSAPGGKTTHLLEAQPNLLELVSVESEPARATRIFENLKRLNLTATVVVEDLINYAQQQPAHSFDKILLDVPCSATGVIRRHPDIKWLRKRGDISALAQQQLAMLEAVWRLLRPGGVLVYATCSVLPQENERVTAQFLAHQTDAREEIIVAEWGIPLATGRQLFPTEAGHDGFYYAKIRRQPS